MGVCGKRVGGWRGQMRDREERGAQIELGRDETGHRQRQKGRWMERTETEEHADIPW